MTDVPPEQRPASATPPEGPTPTRSMPAHPESAQPAGQAPPPQQRFRDRLWGLRAVIAVALAAVILGGLGGAALASFGDHQDGGRFGPGQGRFGRGGPPWQGGGPGFRRGQGRHGFAPPGRQQTRPPFPAPTGGSTTPATPTPTS